MGVFIDLYIQPYRIDADAWKAVYRETLEVLEYCQFLDLYTIEGVKHVYARQSTHVENLFDTGYGGWSARGTMRTGDNIETYALYDSIEYYRGWHGAAPTDRTITQVLMRDEDGGGVVNIFGSKTQGEDAHVYLLAIACLICHRFPDAAYVDGDISAAQCELVVEWINQFLEEPIGVPVNADSQRLLTAIKASGVEHDQWLHCFFKRNLCGINAEVGQCLMEVVSDEQIQQHYSEILFYSTADRKIHLYTRTVKEYLMLGLNFKLLCHMVLVDRQFPLEEFVECIVGMKLHVKEKVTHNYGDMIRNKNGFGIETVDTMLASAFVRMFGMENRNVDAYIPPTEIETAICETLGLQICFSEVAAAVMEKNAEDRKTKIQKELYEESDSIHAICQEEAECGRQYDIAMKNELIEFEPGMTVYPELEKTVVRQFRQLHVSAEKNAQSVLKLDLPGRKAWFDERYHMVVTKENEW